MEQVADSAGDEDITPTDLAEAVRDALEASAEDEARVRRYLNEVTTRIIREEVHKDVSEAAEVQAPSSLPSS